MLNRMQSFTPAARPGLECLASASAVAVAAVAAGSAAVAASAAEASAAAHTAAAAPCCQKKVSELMMPDCKTSMNNRSLTSSHFLTEGSQSKL